MTIGGRIHIVNAPTELKWMGLWHGPETNTTGWGVFGISRCPYRKQDRNDDVLHAPLPIAGHENRVDNQLSRMVSFADLLPGIVP